MNKLISCFGLALVVAMSLVGCELYFNDKDDDGRRPDRWGNPPGFKCDGDNQCAAGCFCEDGICAEGGFCSDDGDCGNGFVCDEQRSSCIPGAACTCVNDAEAIAKGQGWCDEATGKCMPGADPAGMCLGQITCTTGGTKCPEGQVALVKDGCFTGACRPIAECEAAPACGSLQYENDCKARTADCSAVTVLRGCRKPDGTACTPSDTGCVCDSYVFDSCEPRATGNPAVRYIVE